jgi:hypothetical protein
MSNGRRRKGQMMGMDSEDDAAESASKIIDYVIFFLFLIPLTLVLVYAIMSYASDSLYLSPEARHEFAAERVMNCFAIRDDEIGRQYPVFDLSRMTEDELNTCFSRPKQGVRVILEDAASHQELVDIKAYTQDLPVKRRAYPVIYKTVDSQVRWGVLNVDLS